VTFKIKMILQLLLWQPDRHSVSTLDSLALRLYLSIDLPFSKVQYLLVYNYIIPQN